MSEILLIKQINDLALFFSIFNFLIALIYKPRVGLEVFALYALILFVIWILQRKNNRKSSILILPMLLVFLQVRNVYDLLYYGGIFLYGIYAVKKSTDTMNYVEESDLFKKRIAVIMVMILYSIAAAKITSVEEVAILYAIIFITTSIVILRTLRYAEFNKNMKNINEMNIKFAASVTLISFLLSINTVRRFILNGIYDAYEFIVKIVLTVYFYISFGIGYLIKRIAEAIFGAKSQPQVIPPVQFASGEAAQGNTQPDIASEVIKTVRKNHDWDIVMKVIVAAVILLIIVKIIRSNTELYGIHESFKESKERLERNNYGRKGIIKGMAALFRPKSVNEYIRYYYKKFLITSVNRGADISRSDTTWEINKKTERLYNKESLKKIRDIYIRVRYGNYMGDKSTSKEFRNCYEEMKSRK